MVDANNETILWSSTIEFLQEGIEQPLHLKFDGRYIYGSLKDGPYHLRDLQIYHAGDPEQNIDVIDAYTTQEYSYQDFEPSAVISGSVKDIRDIGVGNAFIILEDIDNDYSNIDGDFNIVSTTSGDYYLKIEGPDSLDLEWSIYVDNELAEVGDSLLVNMEIGTIRSIEFIAPTEITDIDDSQVNKLIPEKFLLGQNYPNPFNPVTQISYSITQRGFVKIMVFDIIGNEIETLVEEEKSIGEYLIEFDGSNLTSGIYFYQLNFYASTNLHPESGLSENNSKIRMTQDSRSLNIFSETRKMLLIK